MTTTTETPMIEVRDLACGYGDEAVVEHVDFSVRRGEVFGILGPSGSGKSTVLKCLVGLLQPLAGHVRVAGEDLLAARGRDRDRLLQGVGVAFQQGALFGSMPLLDNVCLPLAEHTDLPPDAQQRIALCKLALVGLGPAAAGRFPGELSGGMRKRAAIARAMALDPAIVFLDEPGAGLDPITQAELDKLIVRLADTLGITFVVVTHELASIMTIVDTAILLDPATRGVAARGTPAELRERDEPELVRRFFRREAAPDEAPT